jgi:hypothetical protein
MYMDHLMRSAPRLVILGFTAVALLAATGCGDDEQSKRQAPGLRRSFDLVRPDGRVVVRLCDGKLIELRRTLNVAFGCTVVDARRGAVTVVAARDRAGHTQSARFNAGAFRVRQEPSGLTELILAGGPFRTCTARQKRERTVPAPDAARGTTRIRRLFGDGRGRFRSRGKFASATVRGTKWGAQDFCHGTLIVVREGRILASDLVRHKTIRLAAPASYFVRPPG